jgi:hypothetical protein
MAEREWIETVLHDRIAEPLLKVVWGDASGEIVL